MNYFTHAIRYLDSPYFVAGACVPDWLSVVDRKARVRQRSIDEVIVHLQGDERECVLGIQQHLHDDRWFHGTAGFYQVTAKIAAEFRKVVDEDESWRCGFLGHLAMELLLDAALIEAQPAELDRFYDCLETVDLSVIERVVSNLATRPVPNLPCLVELFVRERFLADYVSDERLLFRINQVMTRVGLEFLPDEATAALAIGRECVRNQLEELLPIAHFRQRDVLGT